jgi:UDPglucose 6-dehydrogenase
MSAGIMGCGVVGGSLLKACQAKGMEVSGYDIAKPELGPFENLLSTDIIFLCLPTPTKEGVQTTAALQAAISRLHTALYDGVVVIKSTVLPGTTGGFEAQFPSMRFAHNPEFLTEANAYNDTLHQGTILIGGTAGGRLEQIRAFWKTFDSTATIKMYPHPATTEMAKYMHNCMLAIKVGFCNDIYELCQKVKVHHEQTLDYNEVAEAAAMLGKIGGNHTSVPGPDGKIGYGGMCFIKDTTALMELAVEKYSLLMETLQGAIAGNVRRRPGAYDGTENTGYTVKT